jgi:hypothetical protein
MGLNLILKIIFRTVSVGFSVTNTPQKTVLSLAIPAGGIDADIGSTLLKEYKTFFTSIYFTSFFCELCSWRVTSIRFFIIPDPNLHGNYTGTELIALWGDRP